MTSTALVSTGRVVVCCFDHNPAGCCDPEDCGSCCPECPICPTVQAWSPATRAAEAAAHRALLALLAEWARDVHADPYRWEVPPWSSLSTSSP